MIVSMSCCFSDEYLAENMEERSIEDICEFCKNPTCHVISFSLKICCLSVDFETQKNLLIWKKQVVLNNSVREKKKQKDRNELENVKKCSIKSVNERADEDR